MSGSMNALLPPPLDPLDPVSTNPLVKPPDSVDFADAYTSSTNALSAWIAAQRAQSSAAGLWNDTTGLPTGAGVLDAARQYGGALVAGTSEPAARMKPGPVDIGNVTAHVNPSANDIARMMQTAPEHRLRGFHESGNFVIWPAYDATHAEMMRPLGFTEDATNMQLHGRVGMPDADYPQRAGRFSFYGTADPKPSGN